MFDQTPEEGRPGRAPSINVLGGPLQPCSAEPLTVVIQCDGGTGEPCLIGAIGYAGFDPARWT